MTILENLDLLKEALHEAGLSALSVTIIRTQAETLLTEVDRLTAELQTVKAEKDAAIKDLYEACTRSPCNNGICVTKNCTGNIIPCKFVWRGKEQQDG